MYGVYATAYEVSNYLSILADDSYTIQDLRVLDFTLQASRLFDAECNGRVFFPFRDTRLYDHPQQDISVLLVDNDLQAVHTLTTQNGDDTIATANFYLRNGWNYNTPPYDHIELKKDSTQTTFLFSGTTQQANSVDGTWGYHENYSNAWQQVDTVQDNPLSSSATIITVSDADGADELGRRIRFHQQQLLRLGSSDPAEYAYITAVNYSTDKLTVIRAVNGTTAASVVQGTGIEVFRPQHEIVHALLALSGYMYRRKDSVGSGVDQPLASAGVLVLPAILPVEYKQILKKYKRSLIYGFNRT